MTTATDQITIVPGGCLCLIEAVDKHGDLLVIGAGSSTTWRVLAVGPGEYLAGGDWRETRWAPGDEVILGPGAQTHHDDWSGGDVLPDGQAMVQDFEIWAKIERPKETS